MSGFLLFCFFTLFVVRQVVVLAAVFPVRCGSDLLRVVFIVIANFAPANLLISVFFKMGQRVPRDAGMLRRASTQAKLTLVICDPCRFLHGVFRNGWIAMLTLANLVIIGKMASRSGYLEIGGFFKMVS